MGNELSALDDDIDPRLRLLVNLHELEQQLRTASVDDGEQGWDPKDCSDGMIVSDDGKLVTRKISALIRTSDMVRAKNGYDSGIHIWEINWEKDERGSNAVIGVATYQAKPLRAAGCHSLCGSNDQSLGWDIVRNVAIYNGTVIIKYPENKNQDTFKAPETITVILNMDEGSIGFKAGGEHYGIALRGLKKFSRVGKKLYPAVSSTKDGAKIGFKYLGNSLPSAPSSVPKVTQANDGIRVTGQNAGHPAFATQAVETLKFSKQYKGRKIDLLGDATKAEREDFMSIPDGGVVLTSRPLLPNEKFEVQIDRMVSTWIPESLKFGVITVTPGFGVPATITRCKQGLSWIWSGSMILHDGGMVKKFDHSLDNLKIGDKIAVMRQANGGLHFYLNGKDLGLAAENVPNNVYGVVDVYGCTIQVTMTTSGRFSQVSTPPVATTRVNPKGEVELIVEGLAKVIKMMKEKNPVKIEETFTAIEENLTNVYDRHRRSMYRQMMCDKLAEMDGAQAIIGYWLFLNERFDGREEVVIKCYLALRNVCWNFTDASLKLAQELAKCRLIEILANEIGALKVRYQDQEVLKYFMVQCLGILQNCAKPAENRVYYTKHNVPEKLQSLIDPSHHGFINIVAIMTTSYVVEDHRQPEVAERLVADMVNLLREAVAGDNHRAPVNYGKFGSNMAAMELATSFTNLAANAKNQVALVRKGAIIHLVTLMDKGDSTEQECAANCVWSVISPVTRNAISSTTGIKAALEKLGKSDNDAVKQAATRATLKLTEFTQHIPSAAPHSPRKKGVCPYNQKCNRYLKNHLKIKDEFLDTEFHLCYCTECHAERNDKLYYTRGQPPKDFGVPIGWVRFGLQVNKGRAKANKIFEKWHRAYHGTKPEGVNKILDTGDLLMPGDYALGGDKLGEREGHFTDDRKPEGFDTKKIFVSPSIRYAGHDAYATPHGYKDTDEKAYTARVALVVCIEPECYDVGNETVGLGEGNQIDPKFSNQEIEWSTKQRGAVFLYGLLVKLENEISG